MKKILALSIVTASFLLANGYKIPEQSLNGMALSSANIANANAADAAYYNPANMPFMKNKNYFELLMTYINLPPVKFEDRSNHQTYYSRREEFLIPQFHYVSKDFNGYRFGFSIVEPAGLSKKWDNVIPEAGAKEFTLKTVEFNPTIAKKINNNFALSFGLRAIRSDGVANGLQSNKYSFYLNGTSTNFGWNAAVSYQDDQRINKFAVTYRSKINLTLKGDASGYVNIPTSIGVITHNFNTPGKTTIPVPATLNIAYARTFDKTTLEFVFERTFWSEYKNLDFDFDDPIVEGAFGQPKKKNWKDANSYRLGITHQCTQKLTAMLGFAYDKTPVPDETIDFSLPDSDKKIISTGIKYKLDNRLSLGFSALYASQKSRSVSADPTYQRPAGTFSEGGAYLFAFGLDYSY